MKLFFKIMVIWTAIFLCCGCGKIGDDIKDGNLTGPESSRRQEADQAWQYIDTAMGTVIQQTVYTTEETAEEFFEEAMALLTELEDRTLSWRVETSEAARINASAGSPEGCRISGEMASLLESCVELYERSGGAFDVTLGPLVRVWNIDMWAAEGASDDFRVPSEEAIAQALSLCGSDRIRLTKETTVGTETVAFEDGSSSSDQENLGAETQTDIFGAGAGGVQGNTLESEEPDTNEPDAKEPVPEAYRIFMPEGMQLDLGAVGKGVAQYRLLKLLEENRLHGAVISLGGSILTFGEKTDGSPWRVGIINPVDTSSNVGILSLEGQWCVSTSGDYERYMEVDGVRYHHILDPATGCPAVGEVRGVTILAKDGMLSDGLSTACFLLGPERGMALAAEYGVKVLFVMSDGSIVMSDGMEAYFTAER